MFSTCFFLLLSSVISASEKLPIAFSAQSIGALVIHLSWEPEVLPGYVISYRENEADTWISLAPLLPEAGSDQHYQFRRTNPCFDYEFRFQGSLRPDDYYHTAFTFIE